MCLSVISSELTATEDMVVYKVIRQNNTSVYYDFQYKPNTLYRLRKKLKIINNGSYNGIREGFHSFKDFQYATVEMSNWFRTEKIVKFVIPKGAKYYLGMSGDIVSTSIRSGDLKGI